ncbi:acyl-phosphate glycerol-3-phosphate acyltransferase [Planomicrobium soli]|uniref:Glycerol-3-phosphate acyltransferase n=1 Tax=Planomicrobium soli TaxID=1176648 RepID=A0A2P8H2V3_9BACL|nr:glycerol-3-phosphate acyltransferase [Planomicrobium soli]PSL40542.1 acyl-phosphate glycerol-3-phosphate acyltransferase [Planomicrobium soli]
MIAYWIISYVIGNLLTAWWIGKWKGVDLRNELSGNLGARNAGAVIGKSAFFLTFLGDAGKSVFVIWLGWHFQFDLLIIAIGGLLVICGHLFPIWLKGRGGKGIASFIGVTLFLTPKLFLVMFIVFALFLPFVRSATLTMLFSYAAFIAAAIFWHQLDWIWPLIIAIILILIRHQKDLKESFDNRFSKV